MHTSGFLTLGKTGLGKQGFEMTGREHLYSLLYWFVSYRLLISSV